MITDIITQDSVDKDIRWRRIVCLRDLLRSQFVISKGQTQILLKPRNSCVFFTESCRKRAAVRSISLRPLRLGAFCVLSSGLTKVNAEHTETQRKNE